jgi:CAAX prenyl protease-like protein
VIRSPSLPYVGPFAAFLGLLVLSRALPLSALEIQIGFAVAMLVVIAVVAAPAPDLRKGFQVRNWTGSVLIGAFVFVVWIAPDGLFPGYRHHWLFENGLMGTAQAGLSLESRSQAAVLWLRAFRAATIVPLVEELFWRAWLMRWLISSDFLAVPLGTWSPRVFWVVAVLFASEHGSYWDVGLAAGVIYNWWMLRTKGLADLVLAHAVTNVCLSAYVVATGRWQFWS